MHETPLCPRPCAGRDNGCDDSWLACGPCANRHTNADGSVDLYYGPQAPEGKEANWTQTVPGKGWFVLWRVYGPLEPWFDRSWKPGEFELQQ